MTPKPLSAKEEHGIVMKNYFSALVHYQYDINNEVEGAVKEFNTMEKWALNRAWQHLQSLLKKERERVVREVIRMGKDLTGYQCEDPDCSHNLEAFLGVLSTLKPKGEEK